MSEESRGRGRFFGRTRIVAVSVCAVCTAVDLVTKAVVFSYLPEVYYTKDFWLIDNFFSLRLSKNYGALFGAFQGMGIIFIVASIVAAVVIVWYLYVKEKRPTLYMEVSLGILLSGVIGNLYDRVVFGYVRDFIGLHAGDYTWPYFNAADVFICVGVGLLLLRSVKKEAMRCQHAGERVK